MADSGKSLNIQIEALTIFKIALIGLLLYLLYYLFDLVLVIMLAIVIAAAIEPATRWFARYRVPRVLAVLAVYVVAIALFAVLIPVLFFPILADFSDLITTLPTKVTSLPVLASAPAAISAFISRLSATDIFSSVVGGLGAVPHSVATTAQFIFGSLGKLLLIIVISFYLAVQPRGIESFLRLATPREREGYVLSVWKRAQQKIGMWMQGQLLLGLIMGVLVFLGLTIFGVEHALLLALLAALFELIPFFGPILAAVPAVLIAFASSATLGVVMIGFYIIMQQFENHLIYPLVVRKIVGVPPLLVILSLIIGAELAGFMGLILAVPVATILLELLSDYEKSKYIFEKQNA